jgi:predicted O-methyltransferase YrrM
MVWRWEVLSRLCEEHGLESGAEIGVAEGRFTNGLLSAIPNLHLTAVDYWPEGYLTWMGTQWSREQQDGNKAAFMRVAAAFDDRIRLIEKPSVEAADLVDDASLDFVFIDAGHSQEECAEDIAAWSPKVRPGGFVTGHDYDLRKFPSVVAAVNEFFPEKKLFEDTVWIASKA